MDRWYVVQSKVNQEAIATAELYQRSFNVYLPTFIREHQHWRSGKRWKTRLPLFPSYLFVQFGTADHNWKSINRMRGVAGLVGCTDEFLSPLPEGCVEEIMGRMDTAGNLPIEEVVTQLLEFSPEMPLRIRDGLYAGLVGTYCNHSGNRVTLLLALLNSKIRVSLPIEAVTSKIPE